MEVCVCRLTLTIRARRSTHDTPRQVVLIGDGFAEGLGDWVVMGGMAGVTRVLEKHAGSDDKVCVFRDIVAIQQIILSGNAESF